MPNNNSLATFKLSSILRFWRRRRSLRVLKGYRAIKAAGQLHKIAELHQLLRETSCCKSQTKVSEVIFGDGIGSADLIIRQRASKIRFVLTRAILISASGERKSIVCPLPIQWARVLRDEGLRVAVFRCALLWSLYALFEFLKGLRAIGLSLLRIQFNSASAHKDVGPFVHFVNLSQENISVGEGRTKLYNILNWYCQWDGRRRDIGKIYHTVNVDPIYRSAISIRRNPEEIPRLQGGYKGLIFLIWALRSTAVASLGLFAGKWYYSVLLAEAAAAKLMTLAEPRQVASQYFFHNGIYFPPLWTYAASVRGAEIIMYFYSTNSEPIQRSKDDVPPQNMYSLMNWPRYLVWDEFQANVVSAYSSTNPIISIVGPIWFSDQGEGMLDIQGKSVAIFDIQPHRLEQYCSYGSSLEYYTAPVAGLFLRGAIGAAQELDFTVLYKAKRSIGPMLHPGYSSLRDTLLMNSSAVSVEPDIAALNVIQASDLVISMPFTSTAILARDLGKPAVFYDPSSILQPDDPAAHGIPLLQNYQDLIDWMKSEM